MPATKVPTFPPWKEHNGDQRRSGVGALLCIRDTEETSAFSACSDKLDIKEICNPRDKIGHQFLLETTGAGCVWEFIIF